MIVFVIFIVAFLSFLLGFFVNILALPYIIERFLKVSWKYLSCVSSYSIFERFLKVSWKYLSCVSSYSIFRWSVSLIISFAIGIIVIQFQYEKIQKQFDENYQHIIDSLRLEIKIQQVNKSE